MSFEAKSDLHDCCVEMRYTNVALLCCQKTSSGLSSKSAKKNPWV